ncbi:MAG: hypothetical protein IJ475_01590 [Bacilli bacterium]|nr:hypothetical protein [Bacilli bacterium]
MTDEELNEKLRQLEIEDFIWFVYIGIIVLSWYSNSLERKYFVENDLRSKEEYRAIIILIFSILIVVYLYFLYDAYQSVKGLKDTDSEKKKNLVKLSFIGSLLIAISGFIFLYIAIEDEDLNVELAFN